MKKVSLFLSTAAIVVLASCGASTPKASLKTDLDTLTYAIGLSQTRGLQDHLVSRLEMDTTYMNEFVKGLIEGANIDKKDKKKNAYLIGLQIGQQIGNVEGINREIFGSDSTKSINKENLLAGFIAGTLKKEMKMSVDSAAQYVEVNIKKMKEAEALKVNAPVIEKNTAFLKANQAKEGVVTLPSGLQYKVITAGKGAIPTATDKVKVNYKGTLIDGTEFDSSYTRNEPTEFMTTQVIKGWTEALLLMPVGSKWELVIPQELGYGSQESGKIPPFSTLVFEVELVSITPPATPAK